MFKEPYSVNNYINFLFYGVDLETTFPRTEILTIYKNKYERLSKTLPDNAHSINTAYLVIDNFITILNKYYPKFLNNERILLFKNLYNQDKYDKLIFNSNLSLSFVEIETDDDDLWMDIVTNIYYFCNEYINYIHDDSKDAYRILTISIPINEYFNIEKIPDIRDYNPIISLSYYDMIKDISVDKSIKEIFTSELRYLINDNNVIKNKLFTELLENCININIYDTSIDVIRNICREIISYISKDNLYLILHLQFRILEKIFSSNLYNDPDFESMLIKKLTTIMAIDIAIYNESLNIDYENLKLLLLAYNYCIITVQDMIDRLSNDLNGKKISMFMYKSQLFKSRNKPVLVILYILMTIASVFIFFKITNIKISIPLDMIPNKWSDFDFWSKMGKEYKEKFEYVLYMKKYGVDIYNIENLLKSVLYSVFTIILFVINLRIIKIDDIKTLIINNGVSILCSFVAILMIWNKYNFDVNITMVWLIYPLYLCGDYFIKVHGKYLIYEEEVNTEVKIMI